MGYIIVLDIDYKPRADPIRRTQAVPVQESVVVDPPIVTGVLLDPFEWCVVPSGEVRLHDARKRGGTKGRVTTVSPFAISKYPITNGQYQVFLDAEDGYCDLTWWQFSKEAEHWRIVNVHPRRSTFAELDCPRTDVSYYEAVAFCRWLSFRVTGSQYVLDAITLPKESQWQKAGQGSDNRIYPWGNEFDAQKCNVQESGIHRTTSVLKYRDFASPFGVVDLVGNVWEWCSDAWYIGRGTADGQASRVSRGGAWGSKTDVASLVYRGSWFVSGYSGGEKSDDALLPNAFFASQGFRVVCNAKADR